MDRRLLMLHAGVITGLAVIGFFNGIALVVLVIYLLMLISSVVNRYHLNRRQAERRAALVQQLEDEEWALDELARRRKEQ